MPASDNTDFNETSNAVYHRGPYTISGVLAGGIVGSSELFLSYPLELAKTQLQLDKEGRYASTTDVIRKTLKTKGFFSLYRGMSVIMFFTVPQESVRFGVYEQLKSMYGDEQGHLSPGRVFLCGLGAGVIEAVVAVTPMETIKVKLIHDQRSDNPRYKGFFLKSISGIIQREGFHGVYQGLFPTVIKQGTNHGIRFFVVDTMKDVYRSWMLKERVPTPVIGIFGMTAGLCSVFANNPIDVVKTRLQGLQGKEYKSTFNCFRRIYNEEGYFAFYKGTKARCLRVSIDAGYTFMCYDIIRNIVSSFLEGR